MSGKNKNAIRFHLANKALQDDFLHGYTEEALKESFAALVANGVHGYC